MTAHLFKGCAAVICDPETVLRDVDLLVEGPKITAIGKSGSQYQLNMPYGPFCASTIFVRFNEPATSNTVMMTKPIETS